LALAALLNLDRQACGQLALSRPLVAASLVGLAAGRFEFGFCLGLWTELLWLARPPLGGHTPPNGGLAASAAVLGCAAIPVEAELASPGRLMALAALAFALTPPLARLMTGIEAVSRRRAAGRAVNLQEAIEDGESPSAMALQLMTLSTTFGLGLLFLFAGMTAVAVELTLALDLLPAQAWEPLAKAGLLAPVIGVAVMTESLGWRHLAAFALTLAAMLALLLSGARL
jgi:mannose/fructose/N-acetylgalactosamine-specific phosphotransferase system component IIC